MFNWPWVVLKFKPIQCHFQHIIYLTLLCGSMEEHCSVFATHFYVKGFQKQKGQTIIAQTRPTHHSGGIGHSKCGLLSPSCDVAAVFLYLLQQLTHRLGVIGHFAFLQERFQLQGHGGGAWEGKNKHKGWLLFPLKEADSVQQILNHIFRWKTLGIALSVIVTFLDNC